MDESSGKPAKAQRSDIPQEIEKKLIELDPKVFEGITPQKKEKILRGISTAITIISEKTHVGPLPAPETLEAYNTIIPNGADRIMSVFERQSAHRMELEKKVVYGQMFQSNLGQIFAFLIGIFAIGCSTYTILQGFEWAGALLGIGGLTSLVTAFIKGKSSQEQDLKNKKS